MQKVDRATVAKSACCTAAPTGHVRCDGASTPPLVLPCNEVAVVTNQSLQTKLDQGVIAAMQHPAVTVKIVQQFIKVFVTETTLADTPGIADRAAPTNAARVAHRRISGVIGVP